MVSTQAIPQAIIITAGVAQAMILDKVPLMPRIPSMAKHHEVLRARATMEVDHGHLVKVQCLDPSQDILLHDETAAQLSICGGIPGSIDGCKGEPKATTSEVGTALFVLTVEEAGAFINISKEQWMRCMQAARDQCPTGSLSATCVGGASLGDMNFTLENPREHDL
ncbi:hypothetical protein B0J13DRAFT_33575 [Dactylonectria estremocensis]|uniref:Uncharacterized protein n=1 Tax=Dactylonectria estremocensis TaxID=1079267 RepID=A0A9P9FIH0_9HYPO|nr:hypothetical protein B0J13DRAFT_33575 [Dactylonectria estremocensis]